MSCGGLFRPLFPCTDEAIQEAAKTLSRRLPEITLSWGLTGIDSQDVELETGHPSEAYLTRKTALRVSKQGDSYWVYLSHDFLDGYSYWRATAELFRIASGRPPVISPSPREISPKLPRPVRPLKAAIPPSKLGVEGVAKSLVFEIQKKAFSKEKRRGLRVQEYLSVLGAKALGHPANFITSTLIPGYEDCFGHYSLYAGAIATSSSFEIVTPPSTFTLAMLKSTGDFEGCLSSSLPFGIEYVEMSDWFQAFPSNQLARFQISSFVDRYVASVSLNKGLPDLDSISSRFKALLS